MSETSLNTFQTDSGPTDNAAPDDAGLHDALDASWEELAGEDGDNAWRDAFGGDEEEAFGPAADDPGAAPESAPGDFTAEEREAFAALAPEAQSLVAAYAARSHASRASLANELDGLRRTFGPLGQTLSQYEPYMQMLGASPDAVIAGIMPYYLRLAGGDEETRRETIEHLARQFGVGGPPHTNDNADPAVRALRNEVNALKQHQAVAQRAAQQTAYAQRFGAAEQQVDALLNAKDDKGAPKYPDFDRLEDAMLGLLQGGLARSLDDAYVKAAALDPDYQAAARKRTAAAKRAASVNRRGSKAPAAKTLALSIDDSISEAWDELYG